MRVVCCRRRSRLDMHMSIDLRIIDTDIDIYSFPSLRREESPGSDSPAVMLLGLHKIFVHSKAFLH